MEHEPVHLKVENNTLITYPPLQHQRIEDLPFIALFPEHINSFLEAYNIEPTYIDPNYVYGIFDEIHGNWTGMMGHVSK